MIIFFLVLRAVFGLCETCPPTFPRSEMDYKPLDVRINEFRFLTVFPPTVGETESSASELVQCGLEHLSLDELKPDKDIIRPSRSLVTQPENTPRSITHLVKPSFIASASTLVALLLLHLVHRRRSPFSHSLGLFYYVFLLTIRPALGEDISLLLQRAYHRRYFNRFWHAVFCILICPTTLYAVYLTFSSWRTAIAALLTAFISKWLVTRFRRALQILNIDKNTVLLAEGEILMPGSRKFRFTWGDHIALSYTWGNPDPTSMRNIVLNGSLVEVRGNLEAGLRRFRCAPEAYAGVRLWVDALCINQEDLHERSQEVKRMRNMYAHAWTVMVWLGEKVEQSDVAVRALQFPSQQSTKLPIDPTSMSAVQSPIPLFQGVIKPIYRFLSRPYWERLWIIQELAMGDDSTVILCGGLRLYWVEVYEAVRFLAATLGSQRKNFQEEIGEESFTDMSRLLWLLCQPHDVLPRTKDTIEMESLDRALRLRQNVVTSEPRDKVYGLLGLLDLSNSSRIIPDYSLKAREVYIDFAKSVIEATGDLLIILIGSQAGLSDDWPSWVPDLTLLFDRRHPSFNAPYRASGSGPAHARFAHKDEHLCCEGFKIGKISSSKKIRHKDVALSPHRSGHQFGDQEALASSFMGDIKRQVHESSTDHPRKDFNPLTDEAEIEENIMPRPKPGLWQDNYKHNRREAFEYFFHGGMAFDVLVGRKRDSVVK